jgi:hypothetical protein
MTTVACWLLDPVHFIPPFASISDINPAASAYDDVEWVNKLADYLKRIAETKPHIKLIGPSQFLPSRHYIHTMQFEQACALAIKSSHELLVASVFPMPDDGK